MSKKTRPTKRIITSRSERLSLPKIPPNSEVTIKNRSKKAEMRSVVFAYRSSESDSADQNVAERLKPGASKKLAFGSATHVIEYQLQWLYDGPDSSELRQSSPGSYFSKISIGVKPEVVSVLIGEVQRPV
jgi:hypothetical protein